MNSELYFNQKKYISAKRAAEISGYNSDYIGQLCRSGKLECRQVGRGWFVSEESIIEHQKTASEKVRGVIVFPPVSVVSKSADVKIEKTEISPLFTFAEVIAPLRNTALIVLALLFITISIGSLAFVAHNKKFQQSVAIRSAEIIAYEKKIVSNIALETSATLALVRDAVASSSGNKITKTNTDSVIQALVNTVDTVALRAYKTISYLLKINTSHTVVVRDDVNAVSESRDDVTLDAGKTGMIVVPSTGKTVEDEKVKGRIKKSFSDETRVIPDETGTSGVIQPVFKNSQDQDYLYVLVPVDD